MNGFNLILKPTYKLNQHRRNSLGLSVLWMSLKADTQAFKWWNRPICVVLYIHSGTHPPTPRSSSIWTACPICMSVKWFHSIQADLDELSPWGWQWTILLVWPMWSSFCYIAHSLCSEGDKPLRTQREKIYMHTASCTQSYSIRQRSHALNFQSQIKFLHLFVWCVCIADWMAAEEACHGPCVQFYFYSCNMHIADWALLLYTSRIYSMFSEHIDIYAEMSTCNVCWQWSDARP